jgi:radical SAM/Cys-rich protein
VTPVVQLKFVQEPSPSRYDFEAQLRRRGMDLAPLAVDTLQVNITKLCNQVCRHCHVDASPNRREMLSAEGVARCLEILERHPQIATLDITGGAPELHPGFDAFVEQAVALGKRVMVRHNLTVQLDGNPQTGESKAYLPAFFAANRVEVVSSLPYYQAYFTDAQRGAGVFEKSLEAMRRLNAEGYGLPGSGLALNLVYNPVGPYLPAAQAGLEADYKRELQAKFGVVFNSLYTITNMPINRFKLHLDKAGQYEAYMEKLLAAFNPTAAEGVMCRSLLSVDHEGRIYDCDFNQMLGLRAAGAGGKPLSIFDFNLGQALGRRIRFDDHCLGCTAGAGSSCGGATASDCGKVRGMEIPRSWR